jgi:hypothetical protein
MLLPWRRRRSRPAESDAHSRIPSCGSEWGGGGEGGLLLLGRCEGLLMWRSEVLCVLVGLGRRWSVVLEGHGGKGWEGEIAVQVRIKIRIKRGYVGNGKTHDSNRTASSLLSARNALQPSLNLPTILARSL